MIGSGLGILVCGCSLAGSCPLKGIFICWGVRSGLGSSLLAGFIRRCVGGRLGPPGRICSIDRD